MADAAGPARLPGWVTLLDALTWVLLAFAAWDFVTGGVGLHRTIAGVRISLTSELRFSLAALLVGTVRHLLLPRPSLWRRVKPLVESVLSLGTSRPLLADEVLERVGSARVPLLEPRPRGRPDGRPHGRHHLPAGPAPRCRSGSRRPAVLDLAPEMDRAPTTAIPCTCSTRTSSIPNATRWRSQTRSCCLGSWPHPFCGSACPASWCTTAGCC